MNATRSILMMTCLLLLSGCYPSIDDVKPTPDASTLGKQARQSYDIYRQLRSINYTEAPRDDWQKARDYLHKSDQAALRSAFGDFVEARDKALFPTEDSEWDEDRADKVFDEIAKGLR